jgi:glycosyltransferase involved in cell wall biosynthesis
MAGETKRLTIAIPTLNRASLLVRALESALAQTSDEIEILVSDNGSTDKTPAVLARYNDPRLRKLRRETTIPVAQHGTYIFSQVDTEFLLVLSDDDWIEPEFCAEVLALWRRHPELSFIYTGCIEHYDDVGVPALVGPEIETSLDFIEAQAAKKRQVSWCACVTRAADLRRFGPQPDDRIIGDMFFWTKIAFLGPVGCVARPLAHYEALRPDGDNESRATPILVWAEDTRRLHHEILENIRGHADRSSIDEVSLRKSLHRYLAGSVANQFVWVRLSGSSRWGCLKSLCYCFTIAGWGLGSALRVLAAMILPRRQLRGLVLHNARRLQRQRCMAPTRQAACSRSR